MAKRRWLKYTPWAMALRYTQREKYDNISEAEALFGLLVWLGLSRAHAYAIAFPESQATEFSTQQLSSRLVNSWRMHKYFRYLSDSEKTVQFRYDRVLEQAKHNGFF